MEFVHFINEVLYLFYCAKYKNEPNNQYYKSEYLYCKTVSTNKLCVIENIKIDITQNVREISKINIVQKLFSMKKKDIHAFTLLYRKRKPFGSYFDFRLQNQ